MNIVFTGKRALVTGASKGIGRDIAVQLAKGGAQVLAVGRDLVALEKLNKEIPQIIPVQLDISDWKKTEDLLSKVGDIDLLVNNAGLGVQGPLEKVTEEEFDKIYNVNIKALLHVTQIATRNMLKRKVPGSIVNISSQAGLVGLLNHTIYCSSKAAVDGFTRAAALEFGPYNIRVNSVNPTVIMTDMGKYFWSDPKDADPMKAKIPLGRFAEEREVTDAVLYLLSDKSSMINGVTLPIDGGFTAT